MARSKEVNRGARYEKTAGDDNIKYSVIVPTYHEVGNIEAVITRTGDAFVQNGIDLESIEIIFVDDNSNDGSEELVNKLSKSHPFARIIVRRGVKGLSSAVLRGFKEAKGNILLCMDADLQHPPESVPSMFRKLEDNPEAEFVLGTRYGEGVSIDSSWPLYRRVISKGARLLARPLTSLSDPMSGFFAIKREAFDRAEANGVSTLGFKIGLELFVRGNVKIHEEVPFSFGVRTAGESKLSGGVIVQYLLHLRSLYMYRMPFALILMLVLLVLILYYFAMTL